MLAEVAWTRAAPPALLTDASGMVLWLWYEVAVGMSVVVVVLSAYLAARRAPLVGGAAAGLGLVTLALARTAYSYRFTAGWVDVDDGGWEALRREAQAERDGAAGEEELPDLGGDAPNVRLAQGHRWGAAFPLSSLDGDFYVDEARDFAACGDYFADLPARVEGAHLSGSRLAASLLAAWRD